MSPAYLAGPPPVSQPANPQVAALKYVHDQFAGLAAKPDLNFDDVANVAANLVRTQIAPADQVAQQLSEVPRERGKMRAWAMMKQADTADRLRNSSAPNKSA